MLDRRTFLVTGFATCAALASRAGTAVPASVSLALFDARYFHEAEFAALAGAASGEVLELSTAAGPQWMSPLLARLASGTTRILGATSYSDMLLLLDLHRAHGMKLRFHAIHPAQNLASSGYRIVSGRQTADAAWGEIIRSHLQARASRATLHSWVLAR